MIEESSEVAKPEILLDEATGYIKVKNLIKLHGQLFDRWPWRSMNGFDKEVKKIHQGALHYKSFTPANLNTSFDRFPWIEIYPNSSLTLFIGAIDDCSFSFGNTQQPHRLFVSTAWTSAVMRSIKSGIFGFVDGKAVTSNGQMGTMVRYPPALSPELAQAIAS